MDYYYQTKFQEAIMATALATLALFLFISGISNYFKEGNFYQFWSSHVNPNRRSKENRWAVRFFLVIFLISFFAAFLVIGPLFKKFFL
jgi:ABC-type phosphate transport system permease subunit